MTDDSPPNRERAFIDLVQTHQAEVWRYLRFLGCEPALADDVVQEVFLRAWRKPFEDRGRKAAGAYLRRVARSLFLSDRRRQRARAVRLDPELIERAYAEYAREDAGEAYREALRRCLERLSDRARQVLRLFYAEGRSRSATALAVGMTADGVKTTLRRARQSLRECILRRIDR